jgi:hypothetical protein
VSRQPVPESRRADHATDWQVTVLGGRSRLLGNGLVPGYRDEARTRRQPNLAHQAGRHLFSVGAAWDPSHVDFAQFAQGRRPGAGDIPVGSLPWGVLIR